MKQRTPLSYLSFFLLIIIISCKPGFQTQKAAFTDYNISADFKPNPSVVLLMKPYSDSINKTMNDVIGHNGSLLEKKTFGSLGYFMADAFLFMAQKTYNKKVHAAFMNYGGIRLNELPAGPVTRGKMFELMPFDNTLILVTLNGSQLKQYLDTGIKYGGMVLTGISLTIKNKTAANILVDGKQLDENAEYVIANSNYSIDNSPLLKSLPQQNINYLQRDALIEYVVLLNQQGKKITVKDLNRVSNAE